MVGSLFTVWATREAHSWLAPLFPQLSPSLTGFPWLSNLGQVLLLACISCRAVTTTVIWLSACHPPSSTAWCSGKGTSSYFLPHCVLKVLVTQLCPTLCDPMAVVYQAPLSWILQARILEWVAIPFSRGSSWPRDGTQVSSITGRFFTIRPTREAPPSSLHLSNWMETNL